MLLSAAFAISYLNATPSARQAVSSPICILPAPVHKPCKVCSQKQTTECAEVFLQIPQHLLLEPSLATSPQYDLQSAFAALLQSENAAEIDERTLLVLTLLAERAKGDSSKWAPFIGILPQTYSEHRSHLWAAVLVYFIHCWCSKVNTCNNGSVDFVLVRLR